MPGISLGKRRSPRNIASQGHPIQSALRYSVCGVIALPGYLASARAPSNRWASNLDPRGPSISPASKRINRLIWQKYQSDLEVNGSTGGERMPAWSRRIFEKEIRSGRADTNGRESCHNYDSKVSALEEMGSHNRQDS